MAMGNRKGKRKPMIKRTEKTRKKAAPKKDQAWFERKVAELKAELEKLPADRQEQLRRELKEGKEH
jgi:hypothetical protein